jgi:prephenate dehydratase
VTTTSQRLRVAIQGEPGSFSHQAALALLGPEIVILPESGFDGLFAAVAEERADRAMLPIENSLFGSIHENYDRLQAQGLHIVGETQLRIRHCLIGRPGGSVEQIRRAASHVVALAQCRRFFEQHRRIEPVVAYDTAGAVKELLRDGAPEHAAIASRLAAELYGGSVLLEGIEDDPQNYTRFLLLAREPGPLEQASKTTLVFTLKNVPGALHRALGLFASRGVDLTKIESRPLRGRPWEYAFYLDLVGDPRGAAGEAIRELRGLAQELRVLGSYPDGLRRGGAAGDAAPLS